MASMGSSPTPALFGRLNLATGDRLTIGGARFELRARLATEPDHLAGGIGFGPRVLMSQEALRATGLLQPGALVKWLYRVALEGLRRATKHVAALIEAAKETFPEAGWEIRARNNISPQFSRNLDRFTEFLTLVGLTSLIVGGVGVANAIRGFVERKQQTIATLKVARARRDSTVFALDADSNNAGRQRRSDIGRGSGRRLAVRRGLRIRIDDSRFRSRQRFIRPRSAKDFSMAF